MTSRALPLAPLAPIAPGGSIAPLPVSPASGHQASAAARAVITTARLALRPLVACDAFPLAALGSHTEVREMVGHLPNPLSIGSAERWIGDLAAAGDRNRRAFAIVGGLEFLGVCGFAPEGPGIVSIGYFIGNPHWGRGYATEAAGAMISYCFATTAADTIVASHFSGNDASQRVLVKLGFKPAGASVSWCVAGGRERPTLRYALSARDHLSSNCPEIQVS